MADPYSDFLASKRGGAEASGHHVTPDQINTLLHPWQAQVVTWAVRVGRAAIWADTGTGKTFMQLEWARLSGQTSLIVAPLAVCAQTVREAERLAIAAEYVRDPAQITGPGMWVTNYEMVERFPPSTFDAVVLDEASILKQSDGPTRTRLIHHFRSVPRRLACTATPAPNDPEELTNQAEFLSVMSRPEMLAAYFVHDSDGWRLKGHAHQPMFTWMASWAVALRRPSDIGYPDDGYNLPPLNIIGDIVDSQVDAPDQLFATDLGGVGGRAAIRRQTLADRCRRAIEIIEAEPDEPWLVWCGLNDEADTITAAIPDAVNVIGSWSPQDKADAFLNFVDGKIRCLVTKPSIAAFGLNFQHCARMVFVGLSDSMETYYQAIRRCWRYGQTRPVDVHIVVSELERQIIANVHAKEATAAATIERLVIAMRGAATFGKDPS